ncbi:hypothetical protein GUITHDRAFT_143513 [Guillardia theta CCMP2712]|uniref:Uncharacterized protein n=1 Tax=Guillardia theta (strain CCMP2712) TaxID=905079 RepID=L1IT95_GUITC|nr:hypothetical protein GUITHDRAFT_143513 [Guillardia theta CCMP2712]EKX39297.1 hypothetical protein GUITHDRAFT_143513 [Guillardia theta CCMP2712]|eukprot:XP_005826277.1 hypothetical protein GUITHDRAFT_143513 [Guillardia theta CCMP2712]
MCSQLQICTRQDFYVNVYKNGRNADNRPKTMQDFLLSADALFPESSSQISLSAADLSMAIYDNLAKAIVAEAMGYPGHPELLNLSYVHLRKLNKILYTDPVPYDDGTYPTDPDLGDQLHA